MEEHAKSRFVADYLVQNLNELSEYLLQHPEKLVMSQFDFFKAYINLYSQEVTDKSDLFSNNQLPFLEWQKKISFNFTQQMHQLLQQCLNELSKDICIKNEKIAQKFNFYSHQFVDSISPNNFINTNPEIISMTLETNGKNLIEGLKQFQEDLSKGQGQLQIKLTDLKQFEIGKNIASTPGKVIFQNDLMQLIQYSPTTEKVYQNPILMIPPWVNKYYILDLQQENSFVKWLIDRHYTVFMISWVNPTQLERHKSFSDYLYEGPIAALKAITQITKHKNLNVLGYCIGGTLLGCLLAFNAQRKNPVNILSATFLTTLFDFSDPGEIGTFIDEKQIAMLEKHMDAQGYLDGNILAGVFNALRAKDLIWSAFINNYLKGQKPKSFDLLYWNADSTNIPSLVHSFYLRNMYLNNKMVEPGKIKIDNVPIDLTQIKTPSYFLATEEDHIVPWKSCYKSQEYLKAPVRFVLAKSGHVAGVINPPYKNKYGYWTNNSKHQNADKFLLNASFHEGSWWHDWETWIKSYSGKLMSATNLKLTRKQIIEDAPGSYVKVKIAQE